MATKRIAVALLLMATLGQGAYGRTENASLWTKLKEAASIPEGTGGRRLYVFFDANCPYCHDLYETLQPLIGPKQLKVAWIPVGILALSSFGKAADLLEAKDPTAALAQAERGFHQGGSAVRPRRATSTVATELMSNARLLTATGGDGVPFLVYKDQEGRVHAVVGNPPQSALLRIIARIRNTIRSTQKRAAP